MARKTLVSESSPNGVWHLKIGDPPRGYYATHTRVGTVGKASSPEGESWGTPFGYDGGELRVDWHLPDDVCAAYIDDRCYFLFRWGAARRLRRARGRVGMENAFGDEEIAQFCASKRSRDANG